MNGQAWWSVAAVAVLLLLATRRGDVLAAVGTDTTTTTTDGQDEQGQGGIALDLSAALASIDLTQEQTDNMSDNLFAFLAMIRKAETGTTGAEGYRVMFGGRRFSDMSDHPRSPVQFTDGAGRTLWTSAAGAYQFMAVSPIPGGGSTRVNTWDRLAAKLELRDFGQASQDAAAVELISECGALADVEAGRFDAAVAKVRKVWASMPGAGYAQPEKSLGALRQVYAAAGGQLSEG